jgi:antitoxin (DNA-binding transcriptional repressor) of toxin-antitoxin stability system
MLRRSRCAEAAGSLPGKGKACSQIRLMCVICEGLSMTTLTPTNARANLSRLLRRALKGDDIGIVLDGKIIALRPVTVESTDCAAAGYGATAAEMTRFEKKVHAKIKKDRKAGKLHEFTGDIEALVARKS